LEFLGLRNIAKRVHVATLVLAKALRDSGNKIENEYFFDTIRVKPKSGQTQVRLLAEQKEINLRYFTDGTIGIALDETVTEQDLDDLMSIFGSNATITKVRHRRTIRIFQSSTRSSQFPLKSKSNLVLAQH